MARVITFSRTFPAYHPKAGQPTHFVEKFWESIKIQDLNPIQGLGDEKQRFCFETFAPKHHTIRAGSRWKVGDMFSPRVWSGKPYNSKQIIIAPDIEVKKVWDFEMIPDLHWDECMYKSKDFIVDADRLNAIAKNDGLTLTEFAQWFAGSGMMSSKRKPFTGQIICWNESVNY